MKKIKWVLPFFAFVMAVTTSAFTAAESSSDQTRIWYDLKSGGNPTNPLDYFPNLDNEQICFASTTQVCGVFANESSTQPGHPDLMDAGRVYEYKP